MIFSLRVPDIPGLTLRDPSQTELGRRLVTSGITLVDKLGYERFTFRKLGEEISSTEASVYRYFESKRLFINYLITGYWATLEYRLRLQIKRIDDPKRKLEIATDLLIQVKHDDPETADIDEEALYRIVLRESDKVYLIGRKSYHLPHQPFCDLLSKIILEIKPRFKYPQALAITLIGETHRQIFFSENFPGSTDLHISRKHSENLKEFLNFLLFSCLD